MKFARLILFFKYYGQFIPFRVNFILYLMVITIGYQWAKHSLTDTSSFGGIILLMAKIALLFSLAIALLAFLSTMFCMLHLYLKKNKSHLLEVKMDEGSNQQNKLIFQTKLPLALKPLLGFVKLKLQYDNHKLTDKFIVNDRIQKGFFSFMSGLVSKNSLLLPNIKEYHFSKAIIFFEDMLQFFSFSFAIPFQYTICNLPQSVLQNNDEYEPKKTDEELIRIEQLRKVEGEYLNYKKFEDSDDVRRIVWKIFAKHKELVVRTPEIMDPFASHIYMYASFYNQDNYLLYHAFQEEMLNRFKNCVWTIYDTLSEKQFEVKFRLDQSLGGTTNDTDQTRYKIAVSNWHHDTKLRTYFKPKIGSILCIHSFSPIEDVKLLLNECETNTTIFFVKLSQVFKSHYIVNLLLRIFLRPTTDHLSKLRNQWTFHPLKLKTLKHEKNIISLLEQSNLNIEII